MTLYTQHKNTNYCPQITTIFIIIHFHLVNHLYMYCISLFSCIFSFKSTSLPSYYLLPPYSSLPLSLLLPLLVSPFPLLCGVEWRLAVMSLWFLKVWGIVNEFSVITLRHPTPQSRQLLNYLHKFTTTTTTTTTTTSGLPHSTLTTVHPSPSLPPPSPITTTITIITTPTTTILIRTAQELYI